MASPQVENGYTRIANELLEALARTPVPSEARRVLDTIIRKTYGYRKTSDRISLSQFVLSTGLSKSHVVRARKRLLKMNLIAIDGNRRRTKYRMNKDFDSWRIFPNKANERELLPEMDPKMTDTGNESLPARGPTKENTKENSSKKESSGVLGAKPKGTCQDIIPDCLTLEGKTFSQMMLEQRTKEDRK